jgi:drug/metabolite transporter (DMT)-like permease
VYKFIPMALIWGSSFLFIELSLQLTTALGVAFWRTFLGGLAMMLLLAFLKIQLPKKLTHFLHLWVAGLLMSAFPFSMYAFAQQQTTSILAAIMNATTPMFTLLAILTLFRSQRQSSTAIIGLLVGLVGVGITLGIWQGFGENDELAILALLLASISYGIGTPYIRKFVIPLGLPPISAAGVQVMTSAMTLLPFYVLIGPLFVAEPRFETVSALLLLGVLGSGIVYALFYGVVAEAGSTVAANVTYTNPVIATFWGILLLGEPLHWYEPVGGLLVLLGAYLSQAQGSVFRIRKS